MMTPKQVAKSLKEDRRVVHAPNGLVFMNGFLSNIEDVNKAISSIEPNTKSMPAKVKDLYINQVLRELNLSSQVQEVQASKSSYETLSLVDYDGQVVCDDHCRPMHDPHARIWARSSAA